MGLGDRLKLIRGTVSQTVFAKKIGVSQSSLSLYELGTRAPDSTTLEVICRLFDIAPAWLLMGAGPMYYSRQQEEQMADSRPTCESLSEQHTDNIDKKNIASQQNGRQSAILDYMKKTIALQERLLAATEQVAELRLQLQERDMRIHELEKENAGLREAQKGSAALQHDAGWKAG